MHVFTGAKTVKQLDTYRDQYAIPLFDRDLEISRAGADLIRASDRVLVVEGNYLLLNEAPWPEAVPLFDLTVWIEVPEAELDRRLMARWAHYGKTLAQARAWVDGNDLPNIRRVTEGSRKADLVVRWL
jgi:pantothenate kinase